MDRAGAGARDVRRLALAATAGAQTPLQASFSVAPTQPAPGEQVTFSSTTTGNPMELAWDLDGDGAFDDATGPTAQRSFATAGDHVVRLRARRFSTAGTTQESIAERTIPVRAGTAPPPAPSQNQPPTARIALDGQLVRQHEAATFVASDSGDPDGTIVRHDWDLDGDGSFETTTGATPRAARTYDTAGAVTVRLRVTDDGGATAIDELRVSIVPPQCRPTVSVGAMRASAGCFRRQAVAGGVEYRATRQVVINGIVVAVANRKRLTIRVPTGGGRVAIESPSARVTVNAKGNTVTLASGRLAWQVDAANRLVVLEPSTRATLAGLRVTGMPAPPLLSADGSSDVRFYVAMPAQFGGPTSDQPIRVTPGKAAAAASQPLEFTVANAAIGPIGLKRLRVAYDGNGLWQIAASIGLPQPIPFTVSGEAGIRNGAFEYGGAGIDFGTPGIGPFGPVYLQRVKFRIEIKPRQSDCVRKVGVETIDWAKQLAQVGVELPAGVPRYSYVDHGVPTFALCGEVGLTGGPQILGAAAMRLDAGPGPRKASPANADAVRDPGEVPEVRRRAPPRRSYSSFARASVLRPAESRAAVALAVGRGGRRPGRRIRGGPAVGHGRRRRAGCCPCRASPPRRLRCATARTSRAGATRSPSSASRAASARRGPRRARRAAWAGA